MTMELSLGGIEQSQLPQPESLSDKRVFLHMELARAAEELCAAQERYNQLIIQNIKLNEAIHAEGVDTDAIVTRIQPPVMPVLMQDHADQLGVVS